MFSFSKWFGGDSGSTATRPRPRVRLGCERLDERVNPAWIEFTITLDNNVMGQGAFAYNHNELNSAPFEQLAITDFIIEMANGHPASDFLVWDIWGTADFSYGDLQGLTIQGGTDLNYPVYTSFAMDWDTIYMTDSLWNEYYGSVLYGAPGPDMPTWIY